MAYDEALADRVRFVLAPRGGVSERAMFGGIAWMVNGNMACGVVDDDLVVRIRPDATEVVLQRKHTRAFDFTGQPMRGFVVVDGEGLRIETDLSAWVREGADYAATLPNR